MFKVGLLELEALALRSLKMAPCYHAESAIGSEFAVPSGCRVFSQPLTSIRREIQVQALLSYHFLPAVHLQDGFCLLYSEEQRQRSPAQVGQLVPERIFIRDRSCCPKCCIESVKDIIRNEPTNGKNLADLAIIIL